eukprot:1158438-Pelagomonas_calceolata.AAC.5
MDVMHRSNRGCQDAAASVTATCSGPAQRWGQKKKERHSAQCGLCLGSLFPARCKPGEPQFPPHWKNFQPILCWVGAKNFRRSTLVCLQPQEAIDLICNTSRQDQLPLAPFGPFLALSGTIVLVPDKVDDKVQDACQEVRQGVQGKRTRSI